MLGMSRHIDINIGKLCDNACVFCANGQVPPEERPWVPAAKVREEIRRAAASGFDSVGFLGGEIAAYPRAPELVRTAKDAGFRRVVICTNGRKLAAPKLLDEFLDAGLTRIALSIHSHREHIEDRICQRRGAFRQKIAAIENIVKRRERLTDGFSLNTCIHGWNVEELEELVKFFHRLGVNDIRLNALRPEHQAVGNRELVPPFGQVMEATARVVALVEKTPGLTVTFGDLPLCLWPEDFVADHKRASRFIGELRDTDAWVTVYRESRSGSLPDRFRWPERRREQLKVRLPACRDCPVADFCEGPWARYVEIYGDKEFGWPRKSPRPQVPPPRSKRRRRLHIMVSNFCNNRCRFCLEDRQDRRRSDFSDQAKALEIYPSREEVLFTCGEPTLRPELVEWIKKAQVLGYKNIELVTNGRRLAYRRLAEELVSAGLTAVTLSLHCHLEEVHDFLTQARGSCAQTQKALENLIEIRKSTGRPRITTSTVINRYNLQNLADTVHYLDGLGVDCMVLNFVHPLNEALKNFDQVTPRMTEVAAVLEHLPEVKGELKVEGLPLCILPHPTKAGEREIIYIWREGRLQRLSPTRQQKKGPPCRNCSARLRCDGVWIEYARRFGWGEFGAIR